MYPFQVSLVRPHTSAAPPAASRLRCVRSASSNSDALLPTLALVLSASARFAPAVATRSSALSASTLATSPGARRVRQFSFCQRLGLPLRNLHAVCTRKTRVLDVVYNASNNELVRTKTLVKNAIVQIDSAPFRQWYEKHYGIVIAKKSKKVEVCMRPSQFDIRWGFSALCLRTRRRTRSPSTSSARLPSARRTALLSRTFSTRSLPAAFSLASRPAPASAAAAMGARLFQGCVCGCVFQLPPTRVSILGFLSCFQLLSWSS